MMAGMDEFYGGASAVMHRIPAGTQQSSDSGGLLTPTKRRMVRDPHSSTTDVDRYFGVGLGLAGLICENIVSHPFIVMRRQCQVNMMSFRTHSTPFTLLPVIVNLNRWQGAGAMWKGIGSTLTVRGLTLAAEDLSSKFTPWPKEIDSGSSLRMIGQHLLLKSVAMAIVTPFFSASLVETVQSEIASERPGILDVFKEGLQRLACWSGPASGRMLPVWILIPPTVVYGVAKYVVATVAKGLTRLVLKETRQRRQKALGAVSKPNSEVAGIAEYHEQVSAIVGSFAAEALLFPVETILHRMHIQGCRTIVDNLDTGREVVPIITRYEGFFDCLSTITQEEGSRGLFKGFGALVMQYTATFALIKLSSLVVTEIAKIVKQESATPPAELLAQAAALRQQQHEQQPPSSSVVTSTPAAVAPAASVPATPRHVLRSDASSSLSGGSSPSPIFPTVHSGPQQQQFASPQRKRITLSDDEL